jgi:hypothetical protein
MILNILLLLGTASCSSDSPVVRVAWVWGETIPQSDHSSLPLVEVYPEHGFIQLSSDFETLFVDLVKRPPAHLFPEEQSFCSSVLPAAIYDFFSAIHGPGIEAIQRVHVVMDTLTYEAACKCYMRTFVAMGFDHVDGSSVSFSEITQFCRQGERHEISATPARRQRGHLPAISENQVVALSTARFQTMSYE